MSVCFVKEQPSIVAAGLFISSSACCSERRRACSQGGVPPNITAFSYTNKKRRMWFHKYLARSCAFTLSNKMLNLCTTCYYKGVQSIRALSYLYQIRAERIPADTRKISATSLPCLHEYHHFNLTMGKCVRIINFADTLNTYLGEICLLLSKSMLMP